MLFVMWAFIGSNDWMGWRKRIYVHIHSKKKKEELVFMFLFFCCLVCHDAKGSDIFFPMLFGARLYLLITCTWIQNGYLNIMSSGVLLRTFCTYRKIGDSYNLLIYIFFIAFMSKNGCFVPFGISSCYMINQRCFFMKFQAVSKLLRLHPMFICISRYGSGMFPQVQYFTFNHQSMMYVKRCKEYKSQSDGWLPPLNLSLSSMLNYLGKVLVLPHGTQWL